MTRGRLLIHLVPALVLGAAGAAPAGTADDLARVLPRVETARQRFATVGRPLGLAGEWTDDSACRLDPAAGEEPIAACAAWLRAAAGRLRAHGAGDPRGGDVAVYLANLLAGAALDVAGTMRPLAAGVHRLRHHVAGDGSLLQVSPIRPLAAGHRVALEVHAGDAVLRAPAQMGAGAGLSVGALSPAKDGVRAAALADAVAREAATLDGVAPAGAMQLRLPARPAESMPGLAVVLRDAGDLPAADTLEVRDPRAALAGTRARLRALECAVVPAGDPPRPGALASFQIPSLRLRPDGSEIVAPLSVLALAPADVSEDAPVVIGVHGHEQTAAAMLLAHGPGITDEGMVFVAFDLPGHGARADGRPFLDRRDPKGFAASVRQSVADVLAIVAALRCGWPLAGGVTVGRGPVRLLGYSVGSVVGSLTRAVEPDLETAVLLAPGGDLFEWIGLWLAADVEMPLQRCLGGPDAGAACRDTCAAPGVCFVNPELARLADALRVPYAQLLGSVEPMGLAGVRHGDASRGRTLLVSGGRDYVMYPELASRLADAYGMRPPSRHMRRGVHTILVEWPTLGHELSDDPRVRRQAHRFLATDGRRLEPAR